MAITWPDADHGTVHVNVAEMAERLPAEDIALLEAFVVRPSVHLDEIALSARTLLPLSVVEERAERLAAAGLLRRTIRGDRVSFSLAWTDEGRRRTKFKLRRR